MVQFLQRTWPLFITHFTLWNTSGCDNILSVFLNRECFFICFHAYLFVVIQAQLQNMGFSVDFNEFCEWFLCFLNNLLILTFKHCYLPLFLQMLLPPGHKPSVVPHSHMRPSCWSLRRDRWFQHFLWFGTYSTFSLTWILKTSQTINTIALFHNSNNYTTFSEI